GPRVDQDPVTGLHASDRVERVGGGDVRDRQARRPPHRAGRPPGGPPGGGGATRAARAVTCVANEPGARATTSAPTATPSTPGPTATTVPAHSPPSGPGLPGYMSSTLSTSLKLSPAARTRISTPPGPGARRDIGRSVRFSKLPRVAGSSRTGSTGPGPG